MIRVPVSIGTSSMRTLYLCTIVVLGAYLVCIVETEPRNIERNLSFIEHIPNCCHGVLPLMWMCTNLNKYVYLFMNYSYELCDP